MSALSLVRPTVAAAKILLVLTVLLGLGYPALVTGAGRLLPDQADGSLIVVRGRVVGSALLGQAVTDPRFFQGRPSASDSDGSTSGGTNLGPRDPRLAAAVADRAALLRAANPNAAPRIPADALTASGSGLDPDISAAYANWQLPRIVAATGLPRERLAALVADHTTYPALGFIGDRRVNVTTLNVALADLLDR